MTTPTVMTPFVCKNLSATIGALTVLAACSGDVEPTVAPEVLRPVKTLTVATTQDLDIRQLPGVVDAFRHAELAFRVAGVVKSLKVREGGDIKKGQLLAELDTTDFQIQLDKDKANFETAESAFQRGESLIDEGHISKADFETLKANFNTAKAQFSASKQNMAYTRLVAPFSGVIARHHVEKFEEVNAKQVVVSVQDLSKLAVSVDVPEGLMIQIRNDEDRPYTSYATFDAIQGEEFPLEFKEAATKADDSTKTFRVTLVMANPSGFSILPGMTATVHAQRNVADDAPSRVYLPSHAVMEDAQGRFVFIAVPDSDGEATVRRRVVEAGPLTAQGMTISAGLDDGDQVVVAGMSKMNDGLRVRLQRN
ncbi:MAG: efflux RND transporter periplasmic adaptor subunit [Pseudomonadota bacterium]